MAGSDPEEPEFNRQKVRLAHNPIYIGVDAFDESGDDLLSPGMVEIQFLPEIAPEFEKPSPDIALDRFLSQNLGRRPRCSAPP
jgi:hypothetical protein